MAAAWWRKPARTQVTVAFADRSRRSFLPEYVRRAARRARKGAAAVAAAAAASVPGQPSDGRGLTWTRGDAGGLAAGLLAAALLPACAGAQDGTADAAMFRDWLPTHRAQVRAFETFLAQDNGVAFTGASSVPVERYRYRGNDIPTPWTPKPADAAAGG